MNYEFNRARREVLVSAIFRYNSKAVIHANNYEL